MAQRLLESNHQVTMICGSYRLGQTGLSGPFVRGIREGNVDGVHVVEFDLSYSNNDGLLRRSWIFLKYAIGSVALALRLDYDLVFATTTPLTAAIPALAARWLRRKQYVFEVRDLWPELPRAIGVLRNSLVLWALSALEWLAYRNACRCIALSPGIAKGIAQRGVSKKRIAMIPNGCDLSIFKGDVRPWRPPGVTPTDLMAVFAGSHGLANGLDAALDAAGELNHRGRGDIKFVFVGDGKFKSSLMERASREKLTNVIFHDPIPKLKLAGLLRSADVGMQLLENIPAFYYGTSPNKFFDYISAGLPVLNNYPGWLAELIAAEACGFVIPPSDPVAFANALEQAAADRSELRRMGQRALLLAQRDFDRKRLAREWVEWVTHAASGRRNEAKETA